MTLNVPPQRRAARVVLGTVIVPPIVVPVLDPVNHHAVVLVGEPDVENVPVTSVPILLSRSTVLDAVPPIDTPVPRLPEIVLPATAVRVLGRAGEAHRRPGGVDDVDAIAAVVAGSTWCWSR